MRKKQLFFTSIVVVWIGLITFSFGGFQQILRSDYKKLSRSDVESMLKEKGFFEDSMNPSKTFRNQFRQLSIGEDRFVIIDDATGLRWHQSGSEKCLDYEDVIVWIEDLNKTKYGGHNTWRLPTLEEAASLIENRPIDNEMDFGGRLVNNPLHIDPLFSAYHEFIWTGDGYGYDAEPGHTWFVNFDGGTVGNSEVGAWFVRPVRAIDSTYVE